MAERERERDGDLWKRERKTKRGEAWLPRASLGASAERLSAPCHLSRPSLPLVWTPGVWMDPALPRPPRLHHSHLRCSFIPSPCSNARKEPPQLLILSRFCMPTSGVPHFSLRRVGTARNTRRQWFSLPEGKGCLYSSFAGFHQEQEGASATIFLKGGCYYWFYLSIGGQFISRF
jgi:hypothetical protein